MIYIVRHGQTAKNKANILQGRSDVPLNEAGIRQAERVREFFLSRGITVDTVYSSPLIRAVKTAGIIAGHAPEKVDERLIEMDYGPYEGMDLTRPAPEVLTFFKDFVNNPAPAGMEPLAAIVKRSGEFLEEIREEASWKNILISTHAIAMKGLLEYLTPDARGKYWATYIGNCEVYAAEADKEKGYSVPVRFYPGD